MLEPMSGSVSDSRLLANMSPESDPKDSCLPLSWVLEFPKSSDPKVVTVGTNPDLGSLSLESELMHCFLR